MITVESLFLKVRILRDRLSDFSRMEILKKIFILYNNLIYLLIIILWVFLNTYLVFFSLDLEHLNMERITNKLNSMNKESEKMLVVTGNRTQGHWHLPPVLSPLSYDNQPSISTSQSSILHQHFFSLSSFSLIHRI